jgi:hypothetical protein
MKKLQLLLAVLCLWPSLAWASESEGVINTSYRYAWSDNMADFSVYVKMDGNTGLVIDCTTQDTEVAINNVMHTTELSKMMKISRWERSYAYYAGPDFSTLDERLQTGLNEYLQSLGVNEHCAAFVEVMSLDKDQRLYMNWLYEFGSTPGAWRGCWV